MRSKKDRNRELGIRGTQSTQRGRTDSRGVRIGAGKWKGRRIEVPRSARPTSARARESLFDLLGDSVVGARVLDLYAGSGAVGLEAVSRGAAAAVLLERDAGALERTVSRLGRDAAAVRVIQSDAREGVRALERRGEQFDLVFGDPPYTEGIPAEVGERLAALLAPAGRFVLQRDAAGAAPAVAGLRLCSRRAYGRNVFYFLERAAEL